MTDSGKNNNKESFNESKPAGTVYYISLGIALGIVFGVVFDNIGLGIASGVAIGVAIGAAIDWNTAKKQK